MRPDLRTTFIRNFMGGEDCTQTAPFILLSRKPYQEVASCAKEMLTAFQEEFALGVTRATAVDLAATIPLSPFNSEHASGLLALLDKIIAGKFSSDDLDLLEKLETCVSSAARAAVEAYQPYIQSGAPSLRPLATKAMLNLEHIINLLVSKISKHQHQEQAQNQQYYAPPVSVGMPPASLLH